MMADEQLELRPADIAPATTEAALSAYGQAVLRVLAAISAADGAVLEDEYRWYLETGAKLLTPQWQRIPVQVMALSIFLEPPSLEESLKELEASVAPGRVSMELRARVSEAVLELLESAPQAGIKRGKVAEQLIQAIGDDSPERLGRARALLQADRAYEGSGDASAVKGFLSRMLGRGDTGSWIEPRIREINAQFRQVCGRAAWLGEILDRQGLVAAARQVEALLEEQPYRIVLLGEFKHGKSCLFNAIAGEVLSPAGETRPTTAAVVELCHSERPRYEGRWFDQDRLDAFRAYLTADSDNVYAGEAREALESICRQPWFEPGGELPLCPTLEDLKPFLQVTGEYAIAVERVRVGLPVPTLRSGAVLVDTPGLNDPSRVRELISIEEARRADCVVFVLHGAKLGSESERRALGEILRGGRALHVLPVVTHLDLLSSMEAQDLALDEARKLIEACTPEGDRAVTILPPLGINAAYAEQRSSSRSGAEAPETSELGRFQIALRQAMRDPGRTEQYEKRLTSAIEDLRQRSLESAGKWLAEHKARLPNAEMLAGQRDLAEKLRQTGEHYRRHISRRLALIRERLESQAEEVAADIAAVKQDIMAAMRPAMEAEIIKLGTRLANRKAWQELDERLNRDVVEPRLERFRAQQDKSLEQWQDELVTFEDGLREEVEEALEKLRVSLDEIGSLALEQDRILGMTLAAREVLDTVMRQLKAGVVGALLADGRATLAAGIKLTVGLLLSGTGTLVAVGVGATLAASLKWMDKEAARQRFLDKKLEGVERGLTEHFESVAAQRQRAAEEIWDRFHEIANTYYGPVIASAFSVADRVQLQHQIWDKIRRDGELLVGSLTRGELGIGSEDN